MLGRTSLMLVVLMLGTVLAACSDEGDSFTGSFSRTGSDPGASDVDYDEYAEEDAALGYEVEDGESAVSAGQVVASFDRRVIRSGELELAVSDVQNATRQARDIVSDRGGYIASSSAQTLSNDRERSDIAFEVPSDVFDTVMSELRDGSYVVRVDHESTSSQDVTEEYIDLESRLTNLEATEVRFVQLLEDANTISDVLSVESEISRVRGEIERIQGRINYLDQRTSFSRIYVAFELAEDEGVTVAGQHFAPRESAREAWNASMEFIGTIGNGAITVVVFFWWAWPMLGAAIIALMFLRRRRQPAVTG